MLYLPSQLSGSFDVTMNVSLYSSRPYTRVLAWTRIPKVLIGHTSQLALIEASLSPSPSGVDHVSSRNEADTDKATFEHFASVG